MSETPQSRQADEAAASDAAGSDPLEIALRESWVGRVASNAGAAFTAAWPESGVRRSIEPMIVDWSHLSRAQRIRAAALAIAVAMLVERAMTWLLPRPSDPLSAVLPVTVLVTSVAVAALAAPLARVAERLHR